MLRMACRGGDGDGPGGWFDPNRRGAGPARRAAAQPAAQAVVAGGDLGPVAAEHFDTNFGHLAAGVYQGRLNADNSKRVMGGLQGWRNVPLHSH
jgi:hypothetical protein